MDKRFPNLFQPVTWDAGMTDVYFTLRATPPPEYLISNVTMVPYVGEYWLVIRLAEGLWEVPGGTLEANETHKAALKRELMEEAGAQINGYDVLGAWKCHSRRDAPYRPHLPHPDFYRLVVSGPVTLAGRPLNPAGGERVAEVELVPVETAARYFRSQDRAELAELYLLAAYLREQRGGHTP